MYLRYHFLSCIILSLILFPFYSYYSLLILIFGLFIDIDHYIYDIIKTKKLSLINSYKMHMDKNRTAKDQLHIFHTIEFMLLLLLISFYNNTYLSLIIIGFVLHIILDVTYEIYLFIKKRDIKQTRALSLISWLIRNSFN